MASTQDRAQPFGPRDVEGDISKLLFRRAPRLAGSGDQPQVGYDFTTTPQVSRDLDVVEFRAMTLQLRDRVVQYLGSTMHMEPAAPRSKYLQALADLALQRGTQALDAFEATFATRLFEIVERTDAELIVQSQHFVGSEARDGQEIQDACRQLGAHLCEGGVGPGAVKIGNSLRNGVADAREFVVVRRAGSFPPAV